MTVNTPLTAIPKTVNLTARRKSTAVTGVSAWSFDDWVDESANKFVDENGSNIIFLDYTESTYPIEITARPKTVNLTAREKDD